jgi:hypothetical protein
MPNRRLLLAVCTLHAACLPDSSPQEPETASETTAAPVAATTAEESRPGVMTTTEDPESDPTTGSDDTSGAGEVLVAGTYREKASFAGGAFTLNAGADDTDIYVARLRP